ncbi:uncharacterized protein RJT21DRAFT_2034 [Scheffersomyces amazonensis]|uniref:uncharacterized protein n=1 Tax=Scheffersomyces amazonensis TaxID=1078765 RepID=UPI00315C6F7C
MNISNLEDPFDYLESFNRFNENISHLHIGKDKKNDTRNDKLLNPRMKPSLDKRMTLASPLPDSNDIHNFSDHEHCQFQNNIHQEPSQIAIYDDNGNTTYYYDNDDPEQDEDPESDDISPTSVISIKDIKRKNSGVSYTDNFHQIGSNHLLDKYRISKSSNTSPTMKIPLRPQSRIPSIEAIAPSVGLMMRRSSTSNNVGNPYYKPKFKSMTSIPNLINYSQLESNSSPVSQTNNTDADTDGLQFKF